MTPAQQRIASKMSYLQRENTHRNCEVDIRQTGPHWGLYCRNKSCGKTGQWIQWIKQRSLKDQLKNYRQDNSY
jgi:hypothetical protein